MVASLETLSVNLQGKIGGVEAGYPFVFFFFKILI